MKESFYFQHDYEPISDPKITAMVGKFGAVGYGLFWRIVEMLHSDTTHKLPKKEYIFESIAKQMSTPVEQVKEFVKYCTNTCELFADNKDFIISNRVLSNFKKREEISEKRSYAGRISAAKRATSIEQVSTSVQQKATKERKRKEKKEKCIPPLAGENTGLDKIIYMNGDPGYSPPVKPGMVY